MVQCKCKNNKWKVLYILDHEQDGYEHIKIKYMAVIHFDHVQFEVKQRKSKFTYMS